jgi:hypothetical protein
MVRELRERWTLVLAVFCFGWMPLVLAWYYGGRPVQFATIAAVPTAWGVAVLMGGSVMARDLGDGRLGFFFARPVPWWAIGGGKLLAAFLLALATALAGVIPATLIEGRLLEGGRWLLDAGANGTLALQLALVAVLVAVGHVAGVVYRSRSTWAALDVVLFGAAVLLAIVLYREFARVGAIPTPQTSAWRLAVVFLLVALVPLAAAAAQSAWGRSDLRRAHRALSLTFWCGALVWFAVLGGLLARELRATPVDFPKRSLACATNDGRFVALLAGEPRTGRAASFLFDTATGRSLRTPALSPLVFAADGRHAVWAEEAPFWRRRGYDLDLALARLDGPAPKVESVELDPPLPEKELRSLALDAAGERVAVVQPQTLSIHEVPSGRTISRTAVTDGDWLTATFLADGRVRALRRVRGVVGGPGRAVLPGFLEIVELSGGVPSSRVPLEAASHAALASGIAGERLLLHEPQSPPAVSLIDIASGRRLRVFGVEGGAAIVGVALLERGGVAVVERAERTNRLRLAADGEADRLFELPGGLPMLSGELPGGRFAVGLLRRLDYGVGEEAEVGDTLIVARGTGEILRREPGLLPAGRGGFHGYRGESRGGATLFETEGGDMVRLDPDTGTRQIVLAAKSRTSAGPSGSPSPRSSPGAR